MSLSISIVVVISIILLVYFGILIKQVHKEYDKMYEEYQKNNQDISWIIEDLEELKKENRKTDE